MADLYRVDSPINRGQRDNLNLTFEDILKRFSNLQRQINILAGDNDVDELINRIADALTNSEATLSDLQTALTDAQQVIDDMITATTNATNATEAANQATTEATQLFNDMTALQTDLEVLQTSLNQIITDANQVTAAANTATNNANQATQDAQQATTDADNAASRANDAVDAIDGWGQAEPYQTGTYNRNNVVTYEGSTYQSLVDDNTVLPTDNTKWIVLARKGLDGQGAVQTVNSKLPTENGNVQVGIADIGGLNDALDSKANDEDLTALEQTVTQHLDETNTNAHKISNINGLQTVLDNKIDTSLVNYTGLSLLNGIIGSVQIGVFRNGTRRLYIDFFRTTDIPANTIVANIPAAYRPQRSIPVPLANLNTQTFLGWLILKENGDLTTSQVIPGGVSAVNNFIYGGV